MNSTLLDNEKIADWRGKISPIIGAVILRLIQFREMGYSVIINDRKEKIHSVSFNGIELQNSKHIQSANIQSLTTEEIIEMCFHAGYRPIHNCKTSIRVNNFNILIRSQEANKRPLLNHSSRDKFLAICQRLNVSIEPLDDMVKAYWRERRLGLIHEDIANSSGLSPFKNHKSYLKPILTEFFFNGYRIQEGFTADLFLDCSEAHPWDNKVWHIYNKENYIDSIWNQLVFSFRADRGMPMHYSPQMEKYKEVHPWAEKWLDKNHKTVYKGALHIRIQPISASDDRVPPVILSKDQIIAEFKGNIGEQDEFKIKIFLIQARDRHIPLPIGSDIQEICSVGMPKHEYAPLPYNVELSQLSEVELLAMATVCKVKKSPPKAKADVYVNQIGISLKSNRGSLPTLINQTKRSNILRVMKAINSPIAPLDAMINRYWYLRLKTGAFGEDVTNSNLSSPFLGINGEDGLAVLRPMLNYFAFIGTGSKDSDYPATYILEFEDPFDKRTWTYYDINDYIVKVWRRLVFSIRGKGLPSKENLSNEDLPWIKYIDGSPKGTLNVRIGKNKKS